MYRDINIKNTIDLKDIQWIDVRSPSEFAEATIPGAINIPLFTDEERAKIGTVYKQTSQEAAKRLGLEIASAKLPDLIDQISAVQKKHLQPIVFCWRGGMRSKTVATVADLMGIPIYRLEGGYRGYREYIKEILEQYANGRTLPKSVVIHGMTGCGKTMLLHRMHEEGYPVLDLEKMAGHKGSVFGGLGEIEVRNQRSFESLLVDELLRLENAPYMLVEAESKRVGRVSMPDFLMKAKEFGLHIYMQVPLDLRVQRTILQYPMDMPNLQEKVTFALKRIEHRVSPSLRKEWWDALHEKRYEDLIRSLLNDYYDPRYLHAFRQYEGPVYYVDGTDLEACKKEIIQILEHKFAVKEA
jgi:tRNA 2-selenouridine synthase